MFIRNTLKIQATQIDNAEKYALGVIRVEVEDVNDQRPEMTQKIYSGSIAENSAQGTVVLQV